MLLKKSGGKQYFQRDGYVELDDKQKTADTNGDEIVIKNYNTEPIVSKSQMTTMSVCCESPFNFCVAMSLSGSFACVDPVIYHDND